MGKDGLLVSSRSNTKFEQIRIFKKLLSEYDGLIKKRITAHIIQFEIAWCASNDDGELPSRYYFESYTDVDGPYRLGQIRLGPNHGYRSLAMFLDKSSSAYWIYVYKKVRDRQPEDMERGRRIAQRLWNEIESNKER